MPNKRKITFNPGNKTIEVNDLNDTILKVAQSTGINVEGMCNGKGICGKCKIRIEEGDREEFTPAELRHLSTEERNNKMSLACQCKGQGDLKVSVPSLKGSTIQKSAAHNQYADIDNDLKKIYLELPKPSTEDQRADEKRVSDALEDEITHPLRADIIAGLPFLLRQSDFKVTAVIAGKKLLAIEPGDTREGLYGIAFDIGTTTVAGNLLDLNTGKVIASVSRANEQQIYGADVISRIHYTEEEEKGLDRLQQKILDVLNRIIVQLVFNGGITPKKIYRVVAVGNTTMTHLLLGIAPTNLGAAPYIPVFQSHITIPASDLKINVNPNAQMIILPNIASYIGSDTVGVILAENIGKQADTSLTIDIGTNGEVVLASGEKMWACSTAAGPAFEGVHIRCGMRATEGAIEDIEIGEEVNAKALNDASPTGVCGSGLINIVAEMLKTGIVDKTGRLLTPQELEGSVSPKVLEHIRPTSAENGEWEFVLAYGREGKNDVVITQKDLRELQMAKAAIRAGTEILLKEAGISSSELDKVLLTGAFGNHVKKENALLIGLLPDVNLNKIRSVDNAAGYGSLIALASAQKRHLAEQLAQNVQHIELSIRTDFQMTLVTVMGFDMAQSPQKEKTKAAQV